MKKTGSKSKLSKDPYVKLILKKIHNTTLLKNSLNNIVDNFINALDENLQGKYAPFSFHQILLAFIWQKANTRKDLIPFFEQLQSTHPETINQSALKMLKIEQTPLQYTKEDADKYNESIQNLQITPSHIYENYEKIIFSLYSYDFFTNPFPPMIKSLSNVVFLDHKQKSYRFPDCGSTSLRNIINIISYDFDKKTCDIAKLIKPPKKENSLIISPKLRSYYNIAKHKDVNYLQNRLAHNAWAQVTSDLPNVAYITPAKNPICEIGLGISNMLKVINNLLFNSSLEFEQMTHSEKLDLFTSKVSNNNFQLTWKANANINNKIYDKKIVITFTIESTATTSKREFDWHFEQKHFYILVKKHNDTDNASKEKFHLPIFKQLEKLPRLQQFSNINVMTMSSTVNNSELTSLAAPNYSFLYFCSLSKQARKSLIQGDRILPKLEKLYSYTGFLNFLAKEFESLSPTTSRRFITHIIEEKIVEYYNLALEYPIGTIPEQKSTLFNNILKNRMTKYYDYIKKFLKHPFFKTQQIKIVKTIFSNNISQLYNSATEYITNNLKELTSTQEIKVALMEIIISNKISSLFYLIKTELFMLDMKAQKKIIVLIEEIKIPGLSTLASSKENHSENQLNQANQNVGIFANKPWTKIQTALGRRTGLGRQSTLRRSGLRQHQVRTEGTTQ